MSKTVRIIGVGGLLRAVGSDRSRPYSHGAVVELSDEDADRIVKAKVAEFVTGEASAAEPEPEPTPDAEPQLGGLDTGMTIPELREFAKGRDINLKGATTKPAILEVIEDALTSPDDDEGDE